MATYRRSAELSRCLNSVSRQSCPVDRVIVADNAAEREIRRLVEEGDWRTGGVGTAVYLPMPENRGCGAGLKSAELEILQRHPEITHVWILDDDAVPPPDALELLLDKMDAAGADLIVPLLTDAAGQIWAFPEPLDRKQRRIIRECGTPGEAVQRLGAGPHRFRWCTGACVLISRRVLEMLGPHRDDYWMLGEDHEFSLRVAQRWRAVFCCDVVVPHLPPENPGGAGAEFWQKAKFLALLQNLCYNGLRLGYGRGMGRYIPGNFRRYFRDYGWKWRTVEEAGRAFWGGAVLGQAAGGPAGAGLRKKLAGAPAAGREDVLT